MLLTIKKTPQIYNQNILLCSECRELFYFTHMFYCVDNSFQNIPFLSLCFFRQWHLCKANSSLDFFQALISQLLELCLELWWPSVGLHSSRHSSNIQCVYDLSYIQLHNINCGLIFSGPVPVHSQKYPHLIASFATTVQFFLFFKCWSIIFLVV